MNSEPDNGDALKEIQELLKPSGRPALDDLITQQALWDERLLAELRLLGGAARKFTIKTNSYLIFTSECGTGAYSFTHYREMRVGAYRLISVGKTRIHQ